ACLLSSGFVAHGQIPLEAFNEAPSRHYLNNTLPSFYLGNFNDTLRFLQDDLQHATRIPLNNQGFFRWLDSLCYWSLQGECHFQLANYDESLRAFNTALQIYFDQSDWLRSIQVNQPGQAPRIPLAWGTSVRPGSIGDFTSCRFQMSHERISAVPIGATKDIGLMTQNTLSPIRADHIVQCLALTIRRRAEILGSLSKYDPDTKKLATILSNRPHLPNHFTGSWVDVLYGLTLSALGDDTAAETQLTNGQLMLGIHDHHLTPVALNELGNIALRKGNAEAAQTYYLEASYAAYHMGGDPALLGETFRNMANAHRLIQKFQPFPPIIDASVFFRGHRDTSPLTLLPILHEEVEYNMALGRIPDAVTINNVSANIMKGRVLLDTAHGARHHFLAATIAYYNVYTNLASGGTPSPAALNAGNKHLEEALAFLSRGALRLYQLDKLEEFFQKGLINPRGAVTERIADELYDELLRESTDRDWTLQPMESFAALAATPPAAFERWFAVAMQRGNREKAFEISERARQARFFANLPLGESRLMSFRLLFESDEGTLTPEMVLQRQTLSVDFGEFQQLSDDARNVKRQLLNIPIVPQNPEQLAGQKNLFADFERVSLIQESALRVMALSRTKVPMMFPPPMSLADIRKELPENTSMLTFVESLGNVYAFLIDQRSMDVWRVEPESPRAKPLHTLMTDYLRDLGNVAAGQPVGTKELANQEGKWKESGNKLLWRLLGNVVRPTNFSELVIVPTGTLWYVPFESMSVQSGEQLRPLLTAGQTPLVIRYAPTASLGVPQKSSRSVNAETLVLCGKLMSKDTPDVALEAVSRFTKSGVQNLAVMRADDRTSPLPASPSAFASQIQQLVVLDDIPMAPPLGWFPFTSKGKVPVSSWLTLPWGGPRRVVLPAFHTSAESALQQAGVKNGDDLFMSAMLLEACGAQSVLMSRWRSGGRASYDLVEQFLLQLAEKPAPEAWREAIMEVGSHPINVDEEPRVRSDPKVDVPIANHPFFWGAFILIDRGEKAENR
ncbi:MAG: CHAT domain-containing protein, partial [Planctomycetaceae bacterium]|nr:CHAT domain-containing protein [Planctomycetaceae bacterium]